MNKSDWEYFSFETKDGEGYEIVYDKVTARLIEVRMFSDKFNDYIPFQFSYIAQFPSKMAFFIKKVDEQIKAGLELDEECRNTKEYKSDEFPKPAA